MAITKGIVRYKKLKNQWLEINIRFEIITAAEITKSTANRPLKDFISIDFEQI
jgi:hypothetical protein